MSNQILLVKDEREIRETIAAELADAGYDVIQTATGREGLEAIERERPNLILSDISMPELDGTAKLEAFGPMLPDRSGTPGIFLTAYSDRDRQIAARRYGADEFPNKPVDIELLLAVIENQIKKKSSTEEQHEAELVNLFRKMQPQGESGRAPSPEPAFRAASPLINALREVIVPIVAMNCLDFETAIKQIQKR